MSSLITADIAKNKERISKTLQRWISYMQAWKALSEEGKEQLQAVAQRLLYLRAEVLESQIGSSQNDKQNEHMSVLSRHWEKVKELMSKLETLTQGFRRSLCTLETFCKDSSETVLFATLPLSQLVIYVSRVNAAFYRDFTCKKQIVSTFWNYSSRDVLMILIATWWRQPFIDPIELDLFVGSIIAELAIDEYQVLKEDKQLTNLHPPLTSDISNSEVLSFLLS